MFASLAGLYQPHLPFVLLGSMNMSGELYYGVGKQYEKVYNMNT